MTIAAGIALATAVNVRAAETTTPVLGTLSSVTAMELPAKAAELVAQADAKNIRQTTIDVVKAAVGLNPASAAVIVGAIAQASPEMAATAAVTAISLLPKQAAVIARAAAAAAPKQAGKIVEAICRLMPSAYQDVAKAVAEVAPDASREILAGIAAGIPSLRGSINKVLASYNGAVPSVGTALTQVTHSETADTITLASARAFDMPRGPTLTGGSTSGSSTPTNSFTAESGNYETNRPTGYMSP